MIVLPNSFERYLAALRIFVSLSILKHGLQPKHLEKLKKIQFAEAIFNKNSLQSVDIYRLTRNLLGAVSSFKYDLKFSCKAEDNFHINKKLFTLILLTICKHSDNISLTAQKGFIQIKFSGKNANISALLTALKGFLLFESKNNISLVVIPATKTHEESVYIESEWENLFDKFSLVNLFFGFDS